MHPSQNRHRRARHAHAEKEPSLPALVADLIWYKLEKPVKRIALYTSLFLVFLFFERGWWRYPIEFFVIVCGFLLDWVNSNIHPWLTAWWANEHVDDLASISYRLTQAGKKAFLYAFLEDEE